MITYTSLYDDFRLSKKFHFSRWIMNAVKLESKSITSISFIFCSDDYLYNINIKYLKHKTLTDIITFDYSEGNSISGDVFISIDRVRENASTYKSNFMDELHRVMIHGVLHLCGYKDKTSIQQKEMRDKEDYYLSLRTFN